MPIYEYTCRQCKESISVLFFTLSEAASSTPGCTHCGSKDLKRVPSRVAFKKRQPEASPRIGGQASGGQADGQADHPAALARVMTEAAGSSPAGLDESFREVRHRLSHGETADSVEQSLRHRVGEKMEAH